MLYTTLNNSVKMPLLGFGVYQMVDLHECEAAVFNAIKAGYRLIDTAAAYENEEAVGAAIARSDVSREALFITTKVWVQDAGYENTRKAFFRSLERLKLDYLDLYLIHQPYSDVFGSWRAMEELYEEGLIRAIGVSNFAPDRLTDLITFSRIVPAVNQVETHPFHQQINNAEFMKASGVQPESWAPFAEGKNQIFTHPVLLPIARAHNKSVAQVVLRWLIQRGIVVIPKSVKPERMRENFDVFNFSLSDEEMRSIQSLDTGRTLFTEHTDPERIRSVATRKFNT
ncbi:aldo/keto reductase [Klebsiella aerogenes]|nr:aldo/keto reductase [Klebsiella aerogenes]